MFHLAAYGTAKHAVVGLVRGLRPGAQSRLLRDLLSPEELAEVVAMCCSDAGRALNGALVTADGGFGG